MHTQNQTHKRHNDNVTIN